MSCGGHGYALLYAADSCLEAQGTDEAGLDASDKGAGCSGETDGEVSPGRPTIGTTITTQTTIHVYSASTTSSPESASPSTGSPPRNNTDDDRLPSGTDLPSVLSSVNAKSTAAVVLGSVTCAIVLAAAALAFFCLRRRRRRRLKPKLQRQGDTSPSRHPTPLEPGPRYPTSARASSTLRENGTYYASSAPPSNGTAGRYSPASPLTSGSGNRQPGWRSGSAADTERSSTAGPLAILTASRMRVRQAAGGVSLVDASEPSRRYTMPVSAPKEALAGGTCRLSAASEHGWV